MKSIDSLRITALAFAVGALTGCSGGSDGSDGAGGSDASAGESTTLSISLMDAPVDDVREVWVEIASIWLKASDEGPPFELPLEDGPRTVNLLGLTADNAAVLVERAPIPAGAYEWLAMDINAEQNVRDSYVVTNWGTEEEIFLPSGRLRLVDGFEVEENEATRLLFDWDMRMGLVHPPGLGGTYLLKPAFRVIDLAQYGTLHGTITMAAIIDEANNCDADVDPEDVVAVPADVGNSVYVFEGHDVIPDDADTIEGDDAEPVATVEAKPNTAGDYEYETLLPFGDYTVAFTCQAGNDDVETDETDSAEAPVTFWSTVENIMIGAPPAGELNVEVNF